MILQIDSSPQHPSASRELTAELVAELQKVGTKLLHRDLADEAIPHLTREGVVPIRTDVVITPEQQASKTRSDAYISELEAADVLVIGSPMYNFGITSQLKAWFDHVLRAGRTFRYSPEGPVGLLKGKRAIVILTRGGVHSAGPARARDHQEPHLRTMLNFIGIEDVTFILAEGLAMGPDSRAQGFATARAAISAAAERERLAA